MSLPSSLSLARTGLLAAQLRLETASHNISNAETEGFTRQRVNTVENYPIRTQWGVFGTGVRVAGVEATRDEIADYGYRRESGVAAQYSLRRDTLERVEAAFGEFSDAAISGALGEFYNSWSDLANNPGGNTERALVAQSAQRLVRRFNDAAGRITTIRNDLTTGLTQKVDEVNRLLREIANLNPEIVRYASSGGGAPDLVDMQGRAIDKLAKLIDIRAVRNSDGSFDVLSGGVSLVSGPTVQLLGVNNTAGVYRVETAQIGSVQDNVFKPSLVPASIGGGEMQGALDLINVEIPGYMSDLDALVGAIVADVNAVHSAGIAPSGAIGDFFDPAGVTALGISLDANILADDLNIAAGPSGAAGDGAGALTIASMRTAPSAALGGVTHLEELVHINANLGIDIGYSRQIEGTELALINELEVRRASSSGVSIEEEMINVMTAQHAFQAAGKIVSALDEMLQVLLGMV